MNKAKLMTMSLILLVVMPFAANAEMVIRYDTPSVDSQTIRDLKMCAQEYIWDESMDLDPVFGEWDGPYFNTDALSDHQYEWQRKTYSSTVMWNGQKMGRYDKRAEDGDRAIFDEYQYEASGCHSYSCRVSRRPLLTKTENYDWCKEQGYPTKN